MRVDQDKVCERLRTELQDYLDGRLHGARERRVQEHLEGCPLCRRELEDLSCLVAAMQELPTPRPSADFWPRLQARLAAAPRPSSAWKLRVWLPAAVVAAALVLLALLLPRPQQPVLPPVPLESYVSEHFFVAGNHAMSSRVFLPPGLQQAPRRVDLGDDGP